MRQCNRSAMAAPILVIALGCATAKVGELRYAEGGRLPRPPVLLVYDFAVSPSDVVEDTLGPEFAAPSSATSKEDELARKTAASLSEQLVAELGNRGIDARRATDSTIPPVDAIVLKGEFLTIDKGSRTKRMVIGFGAGGSELRARVQAYQATEYGLRRIAQAEAKATGSKAPGMAFPVGAGAAAGQAATSAVISGGMNIVKEAEGGMDADAGRMAGEIAERAEAFYKRQGWL